MVHVLDQVNATLTQAPENAGMVNFMVGKMKHKFYAKARPSRATTLTWCTEVLILTISTKQPSLGSLFSLPLPVGGSCPLYVFFLLFMFVFLCV